MRIRPGVFIEKPSEDTKGTARSGLAKARLGEEFSEAIVVFVIPDYCKIKGRG